MRFINFYILFMLFLKLKVMVIIIFQLICLQMVIQHIVEIRGFYA